MMSFRSFAASAGLLIAASLVGPAAASADGSQQTIVAPQSQGNAQIRVNSQIMSSYKKTTWDKSQSLTSGGTAQAASDDGIPGVPPTDCPPAPTQVCTDSWKPKIINPFPEKDTKTINPFE